jgi:hypothetical protein
MSYRVMNHCLLPAADAFRREMAPLAERSGARILVR